MTSDGGLSISITSGGPSHTVANSSCFNNVNTSVGTGSIYVTNISAAGGYSSGSNYWVRSPYRTGPCKSWREETMAQAIRSIFTRGTPIIEASRSTNIPYPTLFFYTNKVKQILKPYERTVPPGGRNWGSQTSYKMWTKESMFTALKAVFARRMTYQQACDHFCIPVPTFYYYMSRVRKVLKPLEREEYDPAAPDVDVNPDQMSIKGRHGKRLNIAENDLNAAILSVVCRTGKLLGTEMDARTPVKVSNLNVKPVSPITEEGAFRPPPPATTVAPLSSDMEFMSRMNVKPRGRQRSWKQEDMYLAIKAILTHQMSLAKASRQYGIPYPTLKVYLKKVGSMPTPPDFSKEPTSSTPAWSKHVTDSWSLAGGSMELVKVEPAGSEKCSSELKLDVGAVYSETTQKLNISEVYSDSESESSPEDDDDDGEDTNRVAFPQAGARMEIKSQAKKQLMLPSGKPLSSMRAMDNGSSCLDGAEEPMDTEHTEDSMDHDSVHGSAPGSAAQDSAGDSAHESTAHESAHESGHESAAHESGHESAAHESGHESAAHESGHESAADSVHDSLHEEASDNEEEEAEDDETNELGAATVKTEHPGADDSNPDRPNHENDDEDERGNLPPWIEVLTLD